MNQSIRLILDRKVKTILHMLELLILFTKSTKQQKKICKIIEVELNKMTQHVQKYIHFDLDANTNTNNIQMGYTKCKELYEKVLDIEFTECEMIRCLFLLQEFKNQLIKL